MHLQNLISNYSLYNWWANNKIANWLASQNSQLLSEHVSSSFATIDFTLQHMLQTEIFWTAFISGNALKNFKWSIFENKSATILTELVAHSVIMKNIFSSYNETKLAEKLILEQPWAKNNLCRYEYMMHVINHSTYHRGQIITMARTLGITDNIPGTDYNLFFCDTSIHQ